MITFGEEGTLAFLVYDHDLDMILDSVMNIISFLGLSPGYLIIIAGR